MKAVVYYDEETIKCEEYPKPDIQDGEILVKMKVCGICGGDLMHWYRKKAAPQVLGHEITGEVVELGNGVEDLKLGDRVFVHHHIACLTCNYCVHGDYIHCSQFSKNRIYPGGLAEYIKVSSPIVRGDVLRLPDNISYEYGTLIEPLACCIKGMAKTKLRPGDSLGIIGAGPIGIINIELAKKVFGVGKVVASDMLENRRGYAEEYGAQVTVNPSESSFVEVTRKVTDGIGLDAVIVTVSSSQAILEGIESVRNGGVVIIFAPPPPDVVMTLNPNALFFSEKWLVSSYTSSHIETREALKLLSSDTVDLRNLITCTFEMEKAAKAFRMAEAREGMKILISSG